MAEKRFVRTYSQGTMTGTEIWVDTQTGIQYLYHFSGYSGGMTPLLGRDGQPLLAPLPIPRRDN